MKHPLKVQPTLTIVVDNKSVTVHQLPAEIRNEIETLDLYRQKYTDAVLQLEESQILVGAKQAHIEQLIHEHVVETRDKNAVKQVQEPNPE